ncbi:E3 ubiquitin-protein ligase DTX3L-like [Salvelinus fontinalis]|uniref:E3 ubiquitin-protein ligase DTX3L-like n=1 Tax=Salvelinus fontinalis TaxID=8038 RepID=UPI0024855B2D|nr:E3 ubiquitin-protein ligase DTX3L-like [Salvelinus fontinalis]XP_055770590.1 E3 ubiquitin-protein ligase DTX3L-like [Salvelinus fontinalis]
MSEDEPMETGDKSLDFSGQQHDRQLQSTSDGSALLVNHHVGHVSMTPAAPGSVHFSNWQETLNPTVPYSQPHHAGTSEHPPPNQGQVIQKQPQPYVSGHPQRVISMNDKEQSGGEQPSAPPDEATVYVLVELTEKNFPQRWHSTLQRTLQSWFNKEFGDIKRTEGCGGSKATECSVQNILDNGSWAEVKICPSSDLNVLLKQRPTQMTFKDKGKINATVTFHRAAPTSNLWTQTPQSKLSSTDVRPPSPIPQDVKIPIILSARVDLNGFSPEAQVVLQTRFHQYLSSHHSLTMTGNFEEVEQFYTEVTRVMKETEAKSTWGSGGAAVAPIIAQNEMKTYGDCGLEEVKVPVIHFAYLNQAYRKDMERIEKNNGVKINAEVLVSIQENMQEMVRNPTKASQDFIDIVQKCVGEFESVFTPLTHVDPGDLVNMLKSIQNEETRLVINVSANGCNVLGPKQSMVAVKKAFGVGHNSTVKDSEFAGGSGRRSTEIPQKIVMNIKDPLVSDGLSMDLAHWNLMKTAFDEIIKAIQSKFGVVFMDNYFQGMVSVKTRPIMSQHAASLESNAIRALMHLYQKVATSTMSCYLLDTTQAKTVGDMLERIRSRHLCVGAGENYGPWRLIGLPQHLGPAVKELEEKLGGPVFKEKDKQKIGYLEDYRSSAGAAGDRGGATGGAEKEKCTICMDEFTDKEKLSCNHEFCKECLKRSVENLGAICPLCKDVFGMVEGQQPDGTMTWRLDKANLAGFHDCGMIVISYDIPHGQQTKKHPNPGKHFYGTQRTAYLPDNNEGKKVLKLLKKAFDQKLIFTVGTSRTTGADDCVTWNDIHHKTRPDGGAQNFGYPDPDYLRRVKDELKAKGIE